MDIAVDIAITTSRTILPVCCECTGHLDSQTVAEPTTVLSTPLPVHVAIGVPH